MRPPAAARRSRAAVPGLRATPGGGPGAGRAPPAPVRRLLPGAHQVRVAARAHHGPAVLDRQGVGGDGVEQGPVVRHQEDGPVVGLERRLEGLAALRVEVVGRLVQHQQVATAGDQRHQLQAAALAAREALHPGLRGVAREQESAEQRARLGLGEVARGEDRLDDRAVLAEALALLEK